MDINSLTVMEPHNGAIYLLDWYHDPIGVHDIWSLVG
jgi:hypothetical protein